MTLLADRANGSLNLPADGARMLSTPGAVLMPFNAGTAEAAVKTVRRQAEAGADFIKVAVVTPPVFFAAQAEAAAAAMKPTSTANRLTHPGRRCRRFPRFRSPTASSSC